MTDKQRKRYLNKIRHNVQTGIILLNTLQCDTNEAENSYKQKLAGLTTMQTNLSYVLIQLEIIEEAYTD